MFYILTPIIIVASYFFWAFIHELSHYIVRKHFSKELTAKFKIYPHKNHKGKWIWAEIVYTKVFAIKRKHEGWA